MPKSSKGGKITFSTNGAGVIEHPEEGENEPQPKSHNLYKINLKRITDFNAKHWAIKLGEGEKT